MRVQSFNQPLQPKALKRPENPQTPDQTPAPRDQTFILSDRKETFEIVGSALLTGLVAGVSAHNLGSGLGAAASITASTVGCAAYGYASSNKDGYQKLGAVAGGVGGLVMGAVGATGAAVGSLTGHPIVGGLLAGGAMAAWGVYKQGH